MTPLQTSPTSQARPAARPVPTAAPSRCGRSTSAPTTEQLLRQRHELPTGHVDRARLRARVIVQNLPLARRLARRYAGRGELHDDLAQVAALALINAVDSYDPNRQTPFAGYAVPTILGTLKRHFRDSAWGMRVARSSQELAHDVAAASEELTQRQGRYPTPTELADHLDVSAGDVLAAIRASRAYQLTSLNAPHPGTDGAELIDLIGAVDSRYASVDDYLLLQLVLATLPQRERRILTMRFVGDMTQTQIAAQVGLSQMQVSRLLTQSLTRLRAGMAS